MRVLITGGTGFIGSELIPKLLERGFDVYSFERYMTGRYGTKHDVKTVFGDLRDPFTVKKALRGVQPDTVVHLASISPVSYSFDHPHEVMEANFIGTINLAEACLSIPHFKQFLFAGTSEEYGNNGFEVQVESNPLCPMSPYGVSKVACEKYLNYMKEAYEFPVTILRPFNTFGRKKDCHFLIEKTIVQMLRGNEAHLGDPTPVRDWLYVDDHVSAYLTCIDNGKALGETFNFCTGRGLSIKETVNLIKETIGFTGKISWKSVPQRLAESRIIVGSYEKANKILKWKPMWSFESGISDTIKHWENMLKRG